MLLQLLQWLQANLRGTTITYCLTALLLLLSLVATVVIQTGDRFRMSRKLRYLRKYGLSASNMLDQYDSRFDSPEGTTNDGPIRIKALYIHPVKSCGPIEVNRALLTKAGFLYDRSFALATETAQQEKESTWQFISQRTKPSMSLIQTELWLPHGDSDPQDPLVQAGGCLVLTFPDLDPGDPGWVKWLDPLLYRWMSSKPQLVSMIAPIQPTSAYIDELNITMKEFKIHDRDARGLDMGQIPSVAATLPKLHKFLGIPAKQRLTLLKCTPDTLIRTTRNLAPLSHIGSPAVHGYTDQQPININSVSSVHAVSELLPRENQPLNALRFRANIWITGAPAYAEESWKRYRILPKGSSIEARANVVPALSVVCRTSRCTMPNVDPDKGTFDAGLPLPDRKKGKAQPSTTLVKYRTIETGNKKALGYLGMHCVPEDRSLKEAEGQEAGLYVEVGDEIELLETGVHLYGSTGNDY